METVDNCLVDYGVAKFVFSDQGASGDRHLVHTNTGGLLIAAVDGIGHGPEAAVAADSATTILASEGDEHVISLVQRCHENLRATRGVVLSIASIDPQHGMMTWLGVGNVQGVLMRNGAKSGTVQEVLLLRGGVVGAQLPPLQAAVLPIAAGDTLVFATDGIRTEFVQSLSPLDAPQRAADRILQHHCRRNDDALVLVARFKGVRA